MYHKEVLFLAERELHVVVGAVVGEHVAVFAVDGGIDVSFLVKAGGGKTELVQKRGGQQMNPVKIHRLSVQINDRHFDFNADIAVLFLFGRLDIAVVQTADYFFSRHDITYRFANIR